MEILQQIEKDIKSLRKILRDLDPEVGKVTVTVNGVMLAGESLKTTLEQVKDKFDQAKLPYINELERLELILESGIAPKTYTSILTRKLYVRSDEEDKASLKPLPLAKHTFFVAKASRKVEEAKLSKLFIFQDNLMKVSDFYLEHNNKHPYPGGGFAQKIKKGYLKNSDDKPKFAVKIYHKNKFSGDTTHELRIAMRAAYCYKVLGRQGFSFRRNHKQYMVTEWLEGASLDVVDPLALKKIPVSRRIIMAISVLRELALLHKLGLIHHDIKPGNLMVNFGQLSFVDLDSVSLKNEKPKGGSITPIFSEKFLSKAQMYYDHVHQPQKLYLQFNEQTDLYAMGVTLGFLFPEIYIPKVESTTVEVTNSKPLETFTFKAVNLTVGEEYEKHPELAAAIREMINQKLSSPLTTDGCITLFQEILKAYPDHKEYVEEDRLVDLGKDLAPKAAEKAFKEIELELLSYNQRYHSFEELFNKSKEAYKANETIITNESEPEKTLRFRK